MTTPDDAPSVRREEGDGGRGLDAGEDHVAPGRADALHEGLLEPHARGARVPPDQERRAARAVASQHDDGGATEPEGQVARELRAGDAANAIGTEETSHGGKATRGRGSGQPERRTCGSIGR